MPQLSPNLLKRAKQMRSEGVPWKRIGYELGVGDYIIRCELEPGYRQACSARVKRIRGGFAPKRVPRQPRIKKSSLPRPVHMGAPSPTGGIILSPNHFQHSTIRPPADVLADRDRRAAIPPASITAALMGDPPLGRSALDMRKPRLVVSNPEKSQCSSA